METIPKPSERTAERSLLRFWGIVFLLGPLPVCAALTTLMLNWMPTEIARPIPTCGFFGALWGLSCGVWSKQLLRCMIGLNVGAILGAGAGWVLETLLRPSAAVEAVIVCTFSLACLAGAVRVQRPKRLATFISGFVSGLGAFFVMALVYFFMRDVLQSALGSKKISVVLAAFLASTMGIAVLLRGMRPNAERNV